MALDSIATNQRDPEAPLSESDERHPIRRGVAKQPARKACDVFYVGLATLLPKGIRALCSCAGLFFAQFVEPCAGGELYRFRVAAQLRYFNGDARTVRQHVREIFLTPEQAASIFEYDRRLAGLPTCDVRDLVEQHTARVCKRQQGMTSSEQAHDLASEKTVSVAQNNKQAPQQEKAELLVATSPLRKTPVVEDVVEEEPEVVIVPLRVLQETVACDANLHQRVDEKTQEHYPLFRPSGRSLPKRLLRASLLWMRQRRKEIEHDLDQGLEKDEAEELIARLGVLKRQENSLHRALRHRDSAALVTLLPVYGHGRNGQIESCRIEIDVPAQRAA